MTNRKRNRPSARSARGVTPIVPVVPHVDQVTETAPPWTVPEPYDDSAIQQPELVAPMTSPCRLAEISNTSAPRFVTKQDPEVSTTA